ncbi:MAG TPA: tail-specific protease, partial [Pirellulales bacterium]|nr:tail-specific protease [Pirellulales bacterium]
MIRSAVPLPNLRRRYVVTAFLAAIIATAFMAVDRSIAEIAGPQPTDRQVALAVTSLLRREHLTKHPLDAEISRKALKAYLKGIDPMKLYFTQADVDEFMKHQDELCDMAKKGDVTLAYTIYHKFLDRVDERMKLVDELLAKDPDFTVDEEMITDPDKTTYAKDDAETQDKWRKRIKYDILNQKADKK